MPYIKQEDRKKWKNIIKNIVRKITTLPVEKRAGELNYLFTSVLKKAYDKGYNNYNSIAGLLICIKDEFYRRQTAPYEDQKIIENGDVK